jgi:hypothetical protein
MDAARFHNALRILLNLGQHELAAAGVIDGNWGSAEASDRDQVEAFMDDPIREALRMPDANYERLFALVESQQKPSAGYLVWSNEHRAWWGPKRCGYTIHLAQAGRYSREEALSIARNARDGWREGAPPPEIAVRADDAEHCLAGAYLPPFEPTVLFDDGEDRSGECTE